MVRFGRGHKTPDRTTTKTTTTNEETVQAEEVFRDVFAEVQGALQYGDDDGAKKNKGLKKPNPFDDDNNNNNNNSDKDPLTLANSVFKKKKKKGTPLLDISETSATSHESHYSGNTNGNNNTNNNHSREDSVLTLKTSNQTSSSGSTSNKSSSTCDQQQKSYQWHQVLVATETHRQRSAQQQLRECRNRWHAWTQLVRNSLHETQATVRWYVGLHLARDHLLTSLELGSSLLYSDDDEDEEEDQVRDETKTSNAKDDDDELPEKPKRVRDDTNTDDTVCDTNAAALPPDNNNNNDNNNHRPNTTTAATSTTTATVGPPITSITIPSRNAYPHEPVFVLFRQHNLLHQNLWSILMVNNNNNSNDSTPEASSQPSCRIQDMVQQLQTHAVMLDQQALERVRQLEQVEEHVKQAWDTYLTTAEAMFAAQHLPPQQGTLENNKTNGSDAEGVANGNNSNSNKSVSIGDVWLAELAYRCALHQQAAQWAERGQQLEALLGEAHDAERQRRLKLRQVLMEGVLHKHAAAFERIQQVHTEALEQFFEHTAPAGLNQPPPLGSDTTIPKSSNDSLSTKDDKSKKQSKGHRPPKIYTTRERIERMARQAGTTPVMDEEETTTQSEAPSVSSSSMAVDVDGVVDHRDLEESKLPLLKDAAAAARRMSTTKNDEKQKKRDKFAKIKSGVILDLASNKNAMFLDRILYTGSLLESHYIHVAVVAGIEEDAVSPVIDDSLRKAEFKPLLVVVTCDRTVHMFEIPRPSKDEDDPAILQQERAIVPGSSPDNALFYLLGRQTAHTVQENSAKEKAILLKEEAAAVAQQQQQLRSKFIRRSTKTVTTSAPTPQHPFHFDNLRPTVSFALGDYWIRENNSIYSSNHGIKITIKDRDRYDPVQGKSYSKLNFASATDLQSFLLATELTKGELTTI